ncbi:unnamed protein product [Mycena citricolor]|uniref:Auxin efflux carrier n=1 Tax=Mycena citricolor TaxID=2018698 RepID=A0AAD2HY33_9AGAR|nr:unnamed protein product [Mycena citricolor]
MSSQLLEGLFSSSKAAFSVLLVLVYGYLLRKFGFITSESESNISQLLTKFILPSLLFTEIGPLATWNNLRNYWPIIPFSILFQGISFAFAMISCSAGMPQHYVPMFIFNNVTSLPLLLINALGATGALDPLVTPDRPLETLMRLGRVYILINALVGNLMRFAIGPYLMKARTNNEEVGHIALPDEELSGEFSRSRLSIEVARRRFLSVLNPPLLGGISAVFFGLIPWFNTALFGSGILSPLSESINAVGKLFSALQMLICEIYPVAFFIPLTRAVGANLHSKKGSHVKAAHLSMLFLHRFLFAPAISISFIHIIRQKWPHLLGDDPMLSYVLCMSNVGPPALTLSAVAVMAELPPDIEGQVSRILTFAYAASPLIAFPVTLALRLATPAVH